MDRLRAIAGYVALGDTDPAVRERTLSKLAQRLCADKKTSSSDAIVSRTRVLFEGRFGVVAVFDGALESVPEVPVVSDSHAAVVAIGEIWSIGSNKTSHSLPCTEAVAGVIGRDPSSLDQLNGIFAAVHYDDVQRRATIYSDRLGLEPLYYYCDQDLLLFGSTLQSVWEYERIPRVISEDVLGQLLYLGFAIGDQTYLSGVHRVPSGGVVTATPRSGVSARRYWAFEYREDPPQAGGVDDYADEFYRLLRQAASRIARDPGKTGVLLSGGLDSRATLGALVHEYGPVFLACTYGLTETADTRVAREVAAALGCVHQTLTLTRQNLLSDVLNSLVSSDFLLESRSVQIPETTRMVRPLASDWFTGALFNATFSGLWLQEAPRDRCSGPTLRDLVLERGPQGRRFESVVGSRFAALARDAVSEACVKGEAGFAPASPENAFERFMTAYRCRGFHIASHAQFGVGERRFLMCDRDLFDFFLRVPASMRLGKKLYVHMIRSKWPELSRVPYANTGVPVGEPPSRDWVAKRKRSRFLRQLARRIGVGALLGPSPYVTADKAFTFAESQDVRRLIETVLLSERALSRSHVRPEGLRTLVAGLKGDASGVRLLFRLLRTELMIRSCVEADRQVFSSWGLAWHA